MSLPVRPRAGQTEEDLLELQKKFLAERNKTSDHIVEKNIPIANTNESNVVNSPGPSSCPSGEPDPSHPNESGFELNLLLNKKVSQQCEGKSWTHDNMGTIGKHPERKKSLFALRMEKSRAEARRINEESSFTASSSLENKFGDHSYVVKGGDAEEIHQQNTERLLKMSHHEIEEERNNLMSQLSPSTIKFLMSRRKANETKSEKSTNQESQGTNNCVKIPETEEKLASHLPQIIASCETQNLMSKTTHTDGESEDIFNTLPINPDEAKQWLHMDVVEKDKLEWMRALPPIKPSPGPEEPYSARFDFSGMLLPYNTENLETNKGLHHHGEEPERPGYTVQELMQLSRSSVHQQRILGLETIGNILLKYKLGIYDKVLQQNIVKELLDAGLFLLIRFSMDDKSPPVVFASLMVMRNLLFNEPDEASLDIFLGCEGGLCHPSLQVPDEHKDIKNILEQKEEEKELKDFEIIQLDVLKGALRTNLILRLGYILDVLKGPPGPVLDLLIRIARHSHHLAEAVAACGGLLQTIRNELLTSRVVSALAASSGHLGYGEPNAKALKLMRVLSSSSRAMANTLVDKFNIMEPVITYVSMSSPELPQIQSLVVGGFYLWQTLLNYGLASQPIVDLFPILMRQLHFHSQLTSAVGDGASISGHELATALAGVIEHAATIVSSGQNLLEAKPVYQLSKLLGDCTHKWLTQLSSSTAGKPSWSCVKMVGAALSCLAAVSDCAFKQNNPDSVSMLQKLESLSCQSILPFLKSQCLKNLLCHLQSCSFLLSKAETGRKRDPANLPSLGAVEWGGENLVPGLLPEAPHPLLSGLLRFITASHNLFGMFCDKHQGVFLDNVSLGKYVEALVTETLRSSDHWFSRQELYLLHHLMSVAIMQPSAVPSSSQIIYCQLAFCIVDMIQTIDKHLIAKLFSCAIFNLQFLRWAMARVVLDEHLTPVWEECLSSLPVIGSIYGNILGLTFSRQSSPFETTTLISQANGMEPTLPIDWYFAPILQLYGQYNAQSRSRSSEVESISKVVNCLRFLLVAETVWPYAKRPLSVTAKWCRLSLIFLAGSDLFMDSDVKRLLRINMQCLIKQKVKFNFNENIPGLTSFSDLYGELLSQFSAVSYGDSLFGMFLLIPLQQDQDPQLRLMVWGEFATVLQVLSTPIDNVEIPLQNFLEPCETDPRLLTIYLEALAKGHVLPQRCPVLYRVALHHVATYLKLKYDTPFAQSFNNHINQLGNKNFKELILKYDSSVC